jgi:hypothetical protein
MHVLFGLGTGHDSWEGQAHLLMELELTTMMLKWELMLVVVMMRTIEKTKK